MHWQQSETEKKIRYVQVEKKSMLRTSINEQVVDA
jgi:hypothetical protein